MRFGLLLAPCGDQEARQRDVYTTLQVGARQFDGEERVL